MSTPPADWRLPPQMRERAAGLSILARSNARETDDGLAIPAPPRPWPAPERLPVSTCVALILCGAGLAWIGLLALPSLLARVVG